MRHGFGTTTTSAATNARELDEPEIAANALALRRVLLSTGGVGYFEFEAKVSGDAALTLEVRLDQVDDVLKSMVVLDDHGVVGEITLPGKEPLRDLFRELPFDQSAFESEVALLNALRGAVVRVSSARGVVTGSLVAVVAATPLPNGNAAVHHLTLMSEGALKQVVLEEAESVEFIDERLTEQVQEALFGLARQRERNRRKLTVRTKGEGERTVRAAYVVEAPLWKATSRLTVSDQPNVNTAMLQAWAVVENQSGADWIDVDFTLVAGDPVTFRQALYDIYYVRRPEIPVDVAEHVLPRLDEGAAIFARRAARPSRDFAAAPESAPAVATAPPRPADEVEGEETITQVLFHFSAPISLGIGQSALLPLVNREVPAERLSVYQAEISAHSPLASIRLHNDSDTGLPPGAVTLYERSERSVITYLGDARLGALPAGEARLVSFAIDRKVRIEREERSEETFTRAKIVGGVLELTRTAHRTTRYTVRGAAHEPRVVLIEHPRLPGWELAQPKSGVEITNDRYRIRLDVPAGASVPLDVTLEQPLLQRVELSTASSEQIALYVAARELPLALREALARVGELLNTVARKQTAVSNLETDVAEVRLEQARVRENLKVVPAGSALYERYLATLGEQEDRLKALGAALISAKAELATAREALAAYTRHLDLDVG